MIERLRKLHRCCFVVALAVANAAADDLWTVDIDQGPAPSPQDGPPLSRNASRDPSLLKYQIPGIVGGYVGFVLVVSLFMLLVGRRKRRQAQSYRAQPMQMVKPINQTLDPSPISPALASRQFFGSRFQGSKSDVNRTSQRSPPQQSISSFDASVIEMDKVKRQDEMEKLYAAVMAQDPASPKAITTRGEEVYEPPTPSHVRTPSNSSRNFSRRGAPPAVNTNVAAFQDAQLSPTPTTPRITPQSPVRAIYPPEDSMTNNPYATTYSTYPRNLADVASDQYYHEPTSPWMRSPMSPSIHSQYSLPASPRSTRSQQSKPQRSGSTKSKGARSVRELGISAPIPKDPRFTDELDIVDSYKPDTPRTLEPPPPPLPPSQPRPETPILDDEQEDEYEVSFGYDGHMSPRRPSANRPTVPQLNIPPQASQALNYQPQQPLQQYNGNLPLRSPTYQQPPPAQLRQPMAANTNGSLPLRALTNQPTSPSAQMLSPPPVKTTFLSPRRDKFYGGMHSARTPRTGMAAPYSPYMPFTPVTPVTPHLQSRSERKQRDRDEGRGVATNLDEVLNEKDMWGDSY